MAKRSLIRTSELLKTIFMAVIAGAAEVAVKRERGEQDAGRLHGVGSRVSFTKCIV